MNKFCLMILCLLLFVPILSFAADSNTLILNGSGGYIIFGNQGNGSTVGKTSIPGQGTSGNAPASVGQANPSVTVPNPSQPYIAFDREGNASVVTQNSSGAYIGFDHQGNGVVITPSGPGGQSGIDNQGNTWTIAPTR